MAAGTEYIKRPAKGAFERTTVVAARLTRAGPCRIRQVTLRSPKPATQEVTIQHLHAAGDEWDVPIAVLHLQGNRHVVWEPEYQLLLFGSDELVVTCGTPLAISILAEVG